MKLQLDEPAWPILDWFTPENYTAELMAPAQVITKPSLLSVEITKRLKQLGYSRREFERVSGISRQTLFKIEKQNETELRDKTYQLLDEHLRWVPGSAMKLAHGEMNTAEDAITLADRESAYRWRIVEKIQTMTLTDLETMVAIMEQRTLGVKAESTEHHLEMMESKLTELES